MGRKPFSGYRRMEIGIMFEPSAPWTQAQNSIAESSGGEIIRKAYAIGIWSQSTARLIDEIIK
jgi:hypothetical protein